MRDGVQSADALHLDHRGAGALDPGTHLGQERSDIDDLRLTGSVCHGGLPLGQHRCHQDVLGGADAGEVEPDLPAVQAAGRLGDEVAVVDVYRGSQRLQASDAVTSRPSGRAASDFKT